MVLLTRFFEKKIYFLPIADGWGQALGRKFYAPNKENGWYFIEDEQGKRTFRKATLLEIFKNVKAKKSLRMYAFGEEGIPINFDNLLKKGYGNTVRVHFLSLPTFEVAKVILWEDNRFYFYEADPTFQRKILQILKEKFEKEESVANIKGVSPEMAYLLLLADLGRKTYRELDRIKSLKLTEEEKRKRMEEFKNSFAGLLRKTIEDAGGVLVRFVKANQGSFLVHWKMEGSGQVIKTVIKDNMRVLSAGFCLSDYDRAHTMSSIIQLAKTYEEDDPFDGLYITRE